MAGGKIEYSLGLATAGFLGPLRNATVGLAGFIGLAGGLGGAVAGVFNEINRGGALKDLSNRTAESVRDLFQLQFAFEQSGVAASSVAMVLQKYRSSLSGVGEMGESTAEAFALIGTNIETLKKLDAPQALDAIFAGLNKLDRNTAVGVAAKIFGRGASGDILQLARDSEGFASALKDAAAQGAMFDRMANAFDNIGDQVGRLKLQVRGVFLGIASDVAPALNAMLTTLADRDFPRLGQIAELSLTVAFEKSIEFLATALTKLFAAMPDLLKAGQNAGAATIGLPMARMWAQLNAGAAADLAANGGAFMTGSRAEMEAQAEYWAAVADATEEAAPDLAKAASESFRKAIEQAMTAQAVNLFGDTNSNALAELIKNFGAGGAGSAPGIGGFDAGTGIRYRAPENESVNALRRIGFGSGSQSDGLALQRKQLTVLESINQKQARLIEEVKDMDRNSGLLND